MCKKKKKKRKTQGTCLRHVSDAENGNHLATRPGICQYFFFFKLNLFFLQLCVSLGEIKINAHNLRVKTKTKKTAKYTHCPRLLK